MKPQLPILAGLTLLASSFSLAAAEPARPNSIPADYKLLYDQKFDDAGALKQFVMTDPKAWRVAKDEQGGALELAAQSKYSPPVRSPVNIALIRGKRFHDFILEADLIQTGREYGHRDMCLFLGFQGPTQFYYAHIATAADKNAHNIFLVKDQPRTNIANKTTAGVNWGLNVWHRVRLERRAADGTIKVFFDDLTTPIMIAEDKNFLHGANGFGSFDDTGKVDNIKIWGPSSEEDPASFLTAPE